MTFNRLVNATLALDRRHVVMPIQEIRLAAAFADLPDVRRHVPKIIEALFAHPNFHVRRVAIGACRRSRCFDVPGLKEALVSLLRDDEAWVRYDAAWTIADAGYDDAEIRAALAEVASGPLYEEHKARLKKQPGDAEAAAMARAQETLDALVGKSPS